MGLILILFSKILGDNVENVKKDKKIQDGKIVYSDLNKPAKPFFSKRYMIAGKPDYVVKNDDKFFPVEYKSGVYDSVLDNHVFQLAAYCHLIEENFGVFVPFGVIVYSDEHSFKVPFNPKIRFELEEYLDEMRNCIKTGRIVRNHDNKNKCSTCSLRDFCDFKIK